MLDLTAKVLGYKEEPYELRDGTRGISRKLVLVDDRLNTTHISVKEFDGPRVREFAQENHDQVVTVPVKVFARVPDRGGAATVSFSYDGDR